MVKRFGLAVLAPLLLIGCAEEPQRSEVRTPLKSSNTPTYATPSYTPSSEKSPTIEDEEPQSSEGLGTPPESDTLTYSTPSDTPSEGLGTPPESSAGTPTYTTPSYGNSPSISELSQQNFRKFYQDYQKCLNNDPSCQQIIDSMERQNSFNEGLNKIDSTNQRRLENNRQRELANDVYEANRVANEYAAEGNFHKANEKFEEGLNGIIQLRKHANDGE